MPPRPLLRVPTTAQVRPGARVHIVLKQDQPTGRTVQGVVQAVLTRGNHPRGIKVRLADGRVGRVQTMADEGGVVSAVSAVAAEATAPTASAASTVAAPAASAPAPPPRVLAGPSDVRDEAVPLEQVGLDAYIRPAKPKQKKRGRGGDGPPTAGPGQTPAATTPAPPPPPQTCPVCGDFQGDAAAVAHHVAGHFDA